MVQMKLLKLLVMQMEIRETEGDGAVEMFGQGNQMVMTNNTMTKC